MYTFVTVAASVARYMLKNTKLLSIIDSNTSTRAALISYWKLHVKLSKFVTNSVADWWVITRIASTLSRLHYPLSDLSQYYFHLLQLLDM